MQRMQSYLSLIQQLKLAARYMCKVIYKMQLYIVVADSVHDQEYGCSVG